MTTKPENLTRREFVATGGATLGGVLLGCAPSASASVPVPAPPPRAATIVLFQGDSITDGGRSRTATGANKAATLGNGYPLLVAAAALRAHPQRGLQFFNRGISGNKVPDLQSRWEGDTIALAPDIVSILVGVNDFWHTLTGRYAGTVAEYESGYMALLAGTRRALPSASLVVLEPFVLRTGAVDARWFPEFDARRAAAARVAQQAGAIFVSLQDIFDRLAQQAAPEYWAADGVHPTPAGHAAIAERWREVIGL
ncbi:MAG: SGNH/GDSL hydrolase family protein [Gemmatimonadaceae bacterium]